MESHKSAFIIIIVLMAISIPCTIAGIVFKIIDSNKPASPPPAPEFNYNLYQDGILNFYENKELLGIYTCENIEGYCGYAREHIDDYSYDLSAYKAEDNLPIEIINSRYAFIVDTPAFSDGSYVEGTEIMLYDILADKVLKKYKGVKNYNIGLNNDYYIVQDTSGKWGVIQLTKDVFVENVPTKYNFVGVKDNVDSITGKLVSNKFLVYDGSLLVWYFIDTNNTIISNKEQKSIRNYNNDSYYTCNSLGCNLYDFTGENMLEGIQAMSLSYLGNYIAVFDRNHYVYVIDYKSGTKVTSDDYSFVEPDQVEFIDNEDGTFDLMISGEFKETIK